MEIKIYELLRVWEDRARAIRSLKKEIKDFEDNGTPFEIDEYDLHELLNPTNDDRLKIRKESIESNIKKNEVIERELNELGVNAYKVVTSVYDYLKY